VIETLINYFGGEIKRMIKITGLTKTYKTDEVETTALCNVDIEIARGELIAITGPSGCGKSTLLNVLGLIDRMDGGKYFFNDVDVTRLPEKQLAGIRKNNIGFIFQSFNLVNELTVFENIELPLLYTNSSSADRKQRVTALMERMQLAHRKDHYPRQLSGGQQQRVAIARAIANAPKLLLADEPTGNLDSKHGDEVMSMLMDLNETGTTVVMVTHSEQYAKYCRRIISLLDGRIVTEQIRQGSYV
jgi:putative ABC transport system ATP-binding protein